MRASLERESDVFPIATMGKDVSFSEAGRDIRSVSKEVAPRSFEDGCAHGGDNSRRSYEVSPTARTRSPTRE